MTSARRPARPSPEPDVVAEAVRYLSRADRSADQVERHLLARGYSKADSRKALRMLTRLGYVNDEAVAARLAQARLARRPMGRDALAAELEARGFSAGTIGRAVRNAYAGLSEEAVAERFLLNLPKRYADVLRETRRRANLLRGRGFSAEVSETLIHADR